MRELGANQNQDSPQVGGLRLLSTARSRAHGASAISPVGFLLVLAAIIGGGLLMSSWISTVRYKPPLRVGINPWPGYEFAALALEKGFFAEEDIDVRLVELSSLSDCRRAFERGQVDGFFATVVETLLCATTSRRHPQITLVTDYSDGADVILAHREIRHLNDLRNKRVAVEAGSLNLVILANALARAGMDLSHVELVTMPPLEMPRAFGAGSIDAAVCYAPTSTSILRLGTAHELFSTRQTPGYIIDVLAFDRSVIDSRTREIAAFQRAFFRAQEYARRHPREAYAIMAARQGLTEAEFEQLLHDGICLIGQQMQRDFFMPGGMLAQTVAKTHQDLIDLGLIPSGMRCPTVIATRLLEP